MLPFVIAAFIALMVLALVLVGYWLGFPRGNRHQPAPTARPQPYEVGSPAISTHDAAVDYEGSTWVERIALQRVIGGILVLGGLWHAAAPWTFGYADVRIAVIDNLISGLLLAAVGVAFVIFRGGLWLTWIAGAIGVWVLFAPHLLGYASHGFAVNEAVWGGPITILLMVLAGMDQWFSRSARRAPVAGEF